MENMIDGQAMIQFITIATGVESLCLNTFPDFTIIATIGEFCPLNTTTRAIDGFRGNL